MMKHFTDEELTAYLDGEHAFAPVAEIDAALKKDADLRQRLDQMMLDRDALKGAFDALLKQAPPAPPAAMPAANNNSKTVAPWYRQAAAAVVLLALGAGLGNWMSMSQRQLDGWQDYAAAYHMLYGKDTLANVAPTADDAGVQLQRVSDVLGKPVALDKLAAADAISFKRAQVLEYYGQPLVQIAFTTEKGDPVAFCIMRSTESKSVVVGENQGLASAEWSQDGYDYLLIGGKDQKLIQDMAAKLSKSI
jgi:anti-sigma factor RsiW